MQHSISESLALFAQADFFYPFVGIVGLVVGSFLNVVIHRLPRMMERSWYVQCVEYLVSLKNLGRKQFDPYLSSEQTVEIILKPNESAQTVSHYNLVWPGSQCPNCQHQIRAWENIPVLSYLFLRGRCSKCKWHIPIRYPAIECLTALLSLVVAAHYGLSIQLLPALLFTWLMIALTFIDIDTQLLPDELTLLGLWGGLLLSVHSLFISPSDAILGAIIGYLILWSLYWVFKLLTQKEGMGYGDFKLMALAGAWVGWQYLPVVVLISSFTGALWGIISILLRFTHKDHPMPFGPFIALGAWLTLIYGDVIVTSYLQWMR
jgi:leader peptidase (prepilin peptidase)/N-methyltransferase